MFSKTLFFSFFFFAFGSDNGSSIALPVHLLSDKYASKLYPNQLQMLTFTTFILRLNKYFSQGYIPLWWRKLVGSRYTSIWDSFKIEFSCNLEKERKFCLAVTWSTGSTPEKMAMGFFFGFFIHFFISQVTILLSL